MSVYVADELWEKACQVDPLASRSQLVQRGLQRLVDGRAAGAAAIPNGAEEKIEALRNSFAAQAREEYETGYGGALAAAEQIPWYALEDFANQSFDTRRWIGRFQSSAAESAHLHSPPEWLYSVAKTLGSLADPIGGDELSFTPTRARIRGFSDGLRAVFEAVDLETLGLVTTGEAHTGDGDGPAPGPGS